MTAGRGGAADVPPGLREALYCHEILRKAGVDADDIFVDADAATLAVLARVGPLLVLVAVYPVSFADGAACEAAWAAAAQLWNATGGDAAAGWDFDGSDSRAHAVEILAPLAAARALVDNSGGEPPPGTN